MTIIVRFSYDENNWTADRETMTKKLTRDGLKEAKLNYTCRAFFLTLLSFSPSWWGIRVRRFWNPAFIDCIRRLSLELAISRRIRFSCSMLVLIWGVLWLTTIGASPLGGESTPSSDAFVKLQKNRNVSWSRVTNMISFGRTLNYY